MAFLGVFGNSRKSRACFDERAAYLFAPALRFSIDGRVALCHDGANAFDALVLKSPRFFIATASQTNVGLGRDTLAHLYLRYGKKLRRYVPCTSSFALYDSCKGILLLGGTGGEKCFMEAIGDAVLFSSEAYLLRLPLPVDFACLNM